MKKTSPMNKKSAKNIGDYIDRFGGEHEQLLKKMRLTIRKAAPNAQEKISYGIPAFTLNGRMLVWFAAHKSHIGFYPSRSSIHGRDHKLHDVAIRGA